MDQNTQDFYVKELERCLVSVSIRMDLLIMDNGELTLRMVGESTKIKVRDINIQDLGNRINEMVMEEKKL